MMTDAKRNLFIDVFRLVLCFCLCLSVDGIFFLRFPPLKELKSFSFRKLRNNGKVVAQVLQNTWSSFLISKMRLNAFGDVLFVTNKLTLVQVYFNFLLQLLLRKFPYFCCFHLILCKFLFNSAGKSFSENLKREFSVYLPCVMMNAEILCFWM